MADRILTRGLKTGTGAGGVKYILRRGLASALSAITEKVRNLYVSRAKTRFYVSPSKNNFYKSLK